MEDKQTAFPSPQEAASHGGQLVAPIHERNYQAIAANHDQVPADKMAPGMDKPETPVLQSPEDLAERIIGLANLYAQNHGVRPGFVFMGNYEYRIFETGAIEFSRKTNRYVSRTEFQGMEVVRVQREYFLTVGS